jgi:hypothetical protein
MPPFPSPTLQLDTRCGDLTGGQRKRVSIGLGLMGRPRVLFLDEPTTGLDSSAALHVVKVWSPLRAVDLCCMHVCDWSPLRAVDLCCMHVCDWSPLRAVGLCCMHVCDWSPLRAVGLCRMHVCDWFRMISAHAFVVLHLAAHQRCDADSWCGDDSDRASAIDCALQHTWRPLAFVSRPHGVQWAS